MSDLWGDGPMHFEALEVQGPRSRRCRTPSDEHDGNGNPASDLLHASRLSNKLEDRNGVGQTLRSTRSSDILRPSAERSEMNASLALQTVWARSGRRVTPQKISDRQISDLECRYGIRVPDDFRDYLSSSSPVGEAVDSEGTTWWDFKRIKNIPDEFAGQLEPFIHDQRDKYLFFADYMIWCWAWAISCTEDENRGKVALIVGAPHDRFVADSFSDFVAKYNSGVRSVC